MRHTAISSTAALTAAGLALTGCGYDPFEDPGTGGSQPQAGSADQPPSFGEIRRDAFEAMLAADSVTISGEVEAGDADLDELFDGIEEDTTGELQISGAADGTASQMSFAAGGSTFTQRAIDGQEYFRGEDFAALLVSELDDDVSEVVGQDFIAELVADQWVQFDDAEDSSVFSAEEFITTWQEELDGDEVDQMQAESDTRNGQSVWVYSADSGESEFVISAEAEPYVLAITDGDSHYEFSEWGASEAPEPPENVITLDEIFAAIAEEQGWPAEDVEITDEEQGAQNG